MDHSVTEYQRRRDATVTSKGTERLGVLAHRLRSRLTDAMLASAILHKGNVAVGGSTGAMIGRSLRGMRTLVGEELVDTAPAVGTEQSQLVADSERRGDTYGKLT